MPSRNRAHAATARDFHPCTLKRLPREGWYEAAKAAIRENATNRPAVERLAAAVSVSSDTGPPHDTIIKGYIAVLTTKYWRSGSVNLTVGFMEPTPAALADKILSHANAWGTRCNVQFTMVQGSAAKAQVRVSRGPGGYWSYLGVDVLSIPSNQPTMNLEGFSLSTPESEYKRVVRHEFGHTLGCPHEHMRREIIAKLDRQRTIQYFMATQGWSQQEVIQQVLTPLEDAAILGTPTADMSSIMTYQLPSSITVDGKPIPGGTDIDESDYQFMATIYPKATQPPPPPPSDSWKLTFPNGAVISGSGPKPTFI